MRNRKKKQCKYIESRFDKTIRTIVYVSNRRFFLKKVKQQPYDDYEFRRWNSSSTIFTVMDDEISFAGYYMTQYLGMDQWLNRV